MKTIVKYGFFSIALMAAQLVYADSKEEESSHTFFVDCDRKGSINRVLAKLEPAQHEPVIVRVVGACREAVVIDKPGVTLAGERASIDGGGKDALTIDGVQRVVIKGFAIRNGAKGVVGKGGANFALLDSVVSGHAALGVVLTGHSAAVITDTVVEKNALNGLEANDLSHVRIGGRFVAKGNGVFGISILNGSSVSFSKATAQISDNALGVQIGIGSSAFIEDAQTVVTASNNQTIGFTVAAGSTLFIFEGALIAENNQVLDGVSLFSNSSADLDRGASITVKNNGRDGVLLEDSSLNIFTMPGLGGPKIVSSNNGRHGMSALLGSKIDLSGRGQIDSQNNKVSGIFADNGSVLRISDSTLLNNATDVVLSFGTRAEFTSTTQVGSVSCDPTVLIRGALACP